MNSITITIAFAKGPYQYIFAANELPKKLVEACKFETKDFNTLEELDHAVESKKAELEAKTGEPLKTHYIDITPYPYRKGFYPTGGVRWVEKAWEFHQYLNNAPANDNFKKGDHVSFLNSYSIPLEATIFGFSSKGDAILDWDCYWVSKNLNDLTKITT